MAQVTSLRDSSVEPINTGVAHNQKKLAFISGIANSGDNVEVFTFAPQAKGRLTSVIVRQSATLGASATIAAQINRAGTRTTLTGATTAGAASKVDGGTNANMPFDVLGGDVLELVVAGANIGASATVTVDFGYAPRSA